MGVAGYLLCVRWMSASLRAVNQSGVTLWHILVALEITTLRVFDPFTLHYESYACMHQR